ncbi:AAA family ATPase [Paraphoma chrysanthemicola]|uniref:AAA family ATPase n=1 Tax=Paraphoma chrysanthemicola TaxID=798071 RepID=A0A8K0REZ5_9PLEO|nr:AAA family ATPase [Paraphoma chrysanthemicola]
MSSDQETTNQISLGNRSAQAQDLDLVAQLSLLKIQLETLQARVDGAADKSRSINDPPEKKQEEASLSTPPEVSKGVRIATAPDELGATATSPPKTGPIPKVIIPKLNRVRWTDFKNTSLDDQKVFAIDVLIGPAKFYWEKHKEQRNLMRRGREQSESTLDHPGIPHEVQPVVADQTQIPQNAQHEHSEPQSEMPERIRINCERLLTILREISDANLHDDSVVLLRPYKLLIHHERAIRQWLQDLEAKWASRGVPENGNLAGNHQQQDTGASFTNAGGDASPGRDDTQVAAGKAATATEVTETYEALQSLRCLVQFMDTDVTPVHQRYANSIQGKIHFRDLWHLYRPGDIVVSYKDLDNSNKTVDGNSIQESSSAKRQPDIWRVLQVSKGRPVLGAPYSSDRIDGIDRPQAPAQRINKFSILCYMIAYNGKSFGPIDHTFEIAPFEGQKDITSLDPCLAKYVADFDELRSQRIDRGKRFAQYSRPTHCLYTGFTLYNHPSGIPCKAAQKTVLLDGHVIVDFNEAQREDPKWVLQLGLPEASGGSGLETTEDYPRYIWKGQARTELDKEDSEHIHEDNHIDATDMDNFVSNSTFLRTYKDATGEREVDETTFEEVDFALLPDRVVGFDLHRRKFSILALDDLRSVQIKRQGWKDLKLPRGHKHMVQAQVKTHFMEKRLRQSGGQSNLGHDIVRGKGQGLIILLHGAPGVGKTSTAECVAESLQKPLYPITCGDLGVNASVVEETLNSTFAKAETWDCVLLLDEADVFLAQRTRTDLKRNAIVSVFLRVMEYYRGVLILTTNRVGAFDEAFKSRIHLQLYYPILNKDQTLAIWKMNLERIIERKQANIVADEAEILQFAEAHFEFHKTGTTRWNGRQIRNAYQTALAMAEYEAIDGSDDAEWERRALAGNLKAHLKASHFETVANASSQFDSYIEETIGTTDAGRAFTDRDRADHFKWMAPAANVHNEQYNAQWSYGKQGRDGFGAYAKQGHGETGFPPMHQAKPSYAPQFGGGGGGQNWHGASQPWYDSMGRPKSECSSRRACPFALGTGSA